MVRMRNVLIKDVRINFLEDDYDPEQKQRSSGVKAVLLILIIFIL